MQHAGGPCLTRIAIEGDPRQDERNKCGLFADLTDADGIVGNRTCDFHFLAYKFGYHLRIADCIDFVAYYKNWRFATLNAFFSTSCMSGKVFFGPAMSIADIAGPGAISGVSNRNKK